MKNYTSIQLYFEGSLLLASAVDMETEKAFLIQVSNGRHAGQTTDGFWVPKSILRLISEKEINDSSTDCLEIIKKFEIPKWFVTKNKL